MRRIWLLSTVYHVSNTRDFIYVYHICSKHLRNVRVHISFLSLHIIFLNQSIDILLDISHAQHSSTHRGFDDLCNELLVRNNLAALQNPNDGGLAFEATVLGDTDMRLLVLCLGLFELHLVDLDAVFRVFESRIDGKIVGLVDVFSLGVFRQWAQLRARQRLECPLDFWFSW